MPLDRTVPLRDLWAVVVAGLAESWMMCWMKWVRWLSLVFVVAVMKGVEVEVGFSSLPWLAIEEDELWVDADGRCRC